MQVPASFYGKIRLFFFFFVFWDIFKFRIFAVIQTAHFITNKLNMLYSVYTATSNRAKKNYRGNKYYENVT